MKPFDGGGWRGVSRIDGPDDLRRAYDDSGEMLMHLQQSEAARRVRPVAVHRSRDDGHALPARRADARPVRGGPRLPHAAQAGEECVTINRTVNAFFRLGVQLLRDARRPSAPTARRDEVYPIDYANACPDVAVTSLHYYFPWAMKALVQVDAYCLVTGRRHRIDLDTSRVLRDRRPRRPRLRREARALPAARRRVLRDRALLRLVRLPAAPLRRGRAGVVRRAGAWTGCIVETVARDVPARTSRSSSSTHFRGLVGLWCRDEAARLAAAT